MNRNGGSGGESGGGLGGGLGSEPYCAVFQHTVELLGRRWTGAILRVLMTGPHRFGELRATVPGLSDRLLAERLHELEAEGLVARRAGGDGSSIYALSPQGEAIRPVFVEVRRYTQAWAVGRGTPPRPGRIRG